MRISCSLASLVLIFTVACGDESPHTPPTEQQPPAPIDESDAGSLDAEVEPGLDAQAADASRDAASNPDADTADAAVPTDAGGSDATLTPDASMPVQVTYWSHIEPLIKDYCILCHGTTTLGGFTMLTYAEAFQEASGMLTATEAGEMPPACEAGEASECLSAYQVGLIRSWIAQGRPEGTRP